MRPLKSSIVLGALVLLIILGVSNFAYPPLLRQARKFGAKDCTFCHKDPGGSDEMNDRGKWLLSERTRRGASDIDVEWLKDYKESDSKPAAWPEQEAFHEVMSATFHASEGGDLGPTKEKAGDLLQKAKAWEASTPPKGKEASASKEQLSKLTAAAKTVSDKVEAKASDDEIKKALIALHDIFHSITDKK